MRVIRFAENPIIRPHMDGRMGGNINGPSLVRAPRWLKAPLGRYYLYFAHHRGDYIRLAYADALGGPWRTYEPGTLQLRESGFRGHIASPDVHVDERRREIRMYYHGVTGDAAGQATRVAVSTDGIRFTALPEILGREYFRVFRWRGWHYALAMPGILYRSRDGLTGFEQGPTLFTPHMRHCALKRDGNRLTVFYTNAHDCPERILCATIALTADWMRWQASDPVTVLEPQTEYEGAGLPLSPSERGPVWHAAHQLRDPAIYRERGRTYLLYAVAGEQGIAIAQLDEAAA